MKTRVLDPDALTLVPDGSCRRAKPGRPRPAKPRGMFLIRESAKDFYRSREPLDSPFAWVKSKRAAARFASKAKAEEVIAAYRAGKDLAPKLCHGDSCNPEPIIYPPFAYSRLWKQARERHDELLGILPE